MDDELEEQKQFSKFEQYDEFLDIQTNFLKTNLFSEPEPEQEREELAQYMKLTNMLFSYQEQSYLLDPYLERLVTPVGECLKDHAKEAVSNDKLRPSSARLVRLTMLLYGYIKCRGSKTIIRFFPHEVSDLWIALGYTQIPNGTMSEPSQWALRYIVLLWLSLICMLPFDLAQFDEESKGQTATAIESVAKQYLGKAGLERDGAAILLSRLYTRQDSASRFEEFLEWAKTVISSTDDPFLPTGILQVLSETLKSGPSSVVNLSVAVYWPIRDALDAHATLLNNTVVRKYRTKIAGRVGLRLLSGKAANRRARGRTLTGLSAEELSEEGDSDVPEEEEAILEQLFNTLNDRDTVVRYSAAKSIARIAERLPLDFVDQVVETVLGLFSVHSVAAATLYDVPPIAESTWHGACLACAEVARRGLISSGRLAELIPWLSKALYFDIRKGAHSVGSNVRDASAYVLWALARSQDPADLKPHSIELARNLVTVSLYDREVHIRRAASAAFQEFVGRTNLFPHGIAVLGKTDFYSVGIRRNSFLLAAPQVAQHEEYASFLFEHLLNVTLRHWDHSMRRLASESLRLICLVDLPKFGPEGVARAKKLMESPDISDLHGSLLAIAQIGKAYETIGVQDLEDKKRWIFQNLGHVPEKMLLGPRHDILTSAACQVIEASITLTEINLGNKTSVPWRKILEHGLKHRDVSVQEAAASAMGVVSSSVDCSSVVSRLTPELKRGSFMAQQSLGRVLGVIDYAKFPSSLVTSIETLLNCVDRLTGPFRSNVEARRNCYQAIPLIFRNVSSQLSTLLSPEIVNALLDAFLVGLTDYSVDERGDVGSWVRITCITGLQVFVETLISIASDLPKLEDYLPPAKYQEAIKGILKQGGERLDNVRLEAGCVFQHLLGLGPPSSQEHPDRWTVHETTFLNQLFPESDPESSSWNDASKLFPRLVRVLQVQPYREPVLLGIIASIGSLTDSTHRPAATSLVSYVRSLPVHSAESAYDMVTFAKDLFEYGKGNLASNTVMIPVLQVFNVLVEGDAFAEAAQSSHVTEILRSFLSMVCKHADRLKSVRRIHEATKVAVNLLVFHELFEDCLTYIPLFLAHKFPTVRSHAAEYLYLALQRMDLGRETDEADETITETEWSSLDIDGAQYAAKVVVERLKG